MNKFKVTICNREFALQTEEQPAYYVELAEKVEKAVYALSKSTDSLNVFSAAILTALSAFDESKKANESCDNLRAQIKKYADDAGSLRAERDEAQKETESLKAKVSSLENEIKILRMQGNINEQLTLDHSKSPFRLGDIRKPVSDGSQS
jgi:cell division protein ZapA (FtsZ GTPase activity inhibitor)